MDLACGHFSTLLKKNKIKWSIYHAETKTKLWWIKELEKIKIDVFWEWKNNPNKL
jgi:hypothetical protein